MKDSPEISGILDKVVFAALIAQIAFIMYMNLFRGYTMIDFDSSSAYMHEMEMGSQGKLFPSEYSYQSYRPFFTVSPGISSYQEVSQITLWCFSIFLS